MDKLRQKYIALQKAFWDTDGRRGEHFDAI